MRVVAGLVALALLVAGCAGGPAPTPPGSQPPPQPAPGAPAPGGPGAEAPGGPVAPPEGSQVDPGQMSPAEAERSVGEVARKIVADLKAKDMAAIAMRIHPQKGLRFSPYAYVHPDQDVVMKPEEFRTGLAASKVYTWGVTDGRGDPIQLTFADYFQRFVYDVDFAAAPKVGYNESIGTGNTIDNAREVYPHAAIVEFHYPGFDPKFEGMDWKSLRLVLERDGQNWYLVGIIHAQWTI